MLHFNKFSRRLFLKTSSGYILSLPLIPSLISKAISSAMADELSLDQTPNSIFIRTVYGCYEELKYIKDIPGEDITEKWIKETIQFGSNSNLREGVLRIKNLSDYKIGSTHHPISDLCGTAFQEADLLDYLTLPLGNSGFHSGNHCNTSPFCGTGQVSDDNKVPHINQSSIDVLIENKIKGLYPGHKAIRVMPAGRLTTSSGSCSYSYDPQTKSFIRLPYLESVEDLFNLFFQVEKTNVDGMKKSAMDNVALEYAKLAKLVSPEEKVLLDQYGQKIHEISNLIGSSKVCTSPVYEAKDKNRVSTMYKAANTLITQAFKCGLSKVVCYDMCHYQENDFDPSAFAASHHPKDGNSLNTAANIFNRDLIIDLASKLKATPNASSGNLLDDSIIFQTSEDNWNHVVDGGQTILILGKGKGKINSGKIYDYRLRYNENFINDGDELVYRINGNARQYGAIGWSPYYLLLEGFMQASGLTRADYLLPGQYCYGHSVHNWSATYSGLRTKLDKFTDPTIKNTKNSNGYYIYREPEDQTYFTTAENFLGTTPKLFNV